MLQVVNLRCEYRSNPLGLDVVAPRFSWSLDSDRRGVEQSRYEIEVAEQEGGRLVWQSGKVYSSRSNLVAYQGLPLEACRAYRWRVRACTEAEKSCWSAWSSFETGLMDAGRWQARWIAGGAPASEMTRLPLMRRSFLLAAPVRSARVYASALGLYRLRINGQAVGADYFTPGWTCYDKRVQYQCYDVTDLLHTGENALGVMLGDGWYHGQVIRQHAGRNYGDTLAALVQLAVTLEGGQEVLLCSDGQWKWHTGPIVTSDFYLGETYDARLELPGWDQPGFDDGDWASCREIDHPLDILVAQEGIPARAQELLKPVAVLKTPRGETVLDMGQNMVGVMRFTVEGPQGHTLALRHAEVLDKDGNFYTGNLRRADPHFTVTLRGGRASYEPAFTHMGFRYVRLENWPCPVDPDDFTGVVIHSDLERTGDFACSDPMVNQLYHNVVWGQKGNFVDVPTDCPQRDERLGWTGDAQAFIRTACFNMSSAPLFTKWLHDLKLDQRSDGAVPHVVPNVLGEKNCGSSAWGDAAAICPWTLYSCYGDRRILEQQYSSMKAWVEYIRATGDERNLWDTGFQFGDWLALDAHPKEGQESYTGLTDIYYIASAFYLYSVTLVAKTAHLLGQTKDAKRYDKMREKILRHIRREYITPTGRLAIATQTAHVLALHFGIVEDKHIQRTADELVRLIAQNDYHLDTGFVGTPYLLLTLSEHGYHDVACRLFMQKDFPSWLYPITKGATTIWEHWDGIRPDGSFWSDDMNSYNHSAYGCVAEWMTRYAVGLDLDEADPAYHHSVIHPRFVPELAWAQASLETSYGRLALRWQREDGRMLVKLQIPENTYATVVLEQAELSGLTEGGRPIAACEGLRDAQASGDGVELTLGSGRYELAYPLNAS